MKTITCPHGAYVNIYYLDEEVNQLNYQFEFSCCDIYVRLNNYIINNLFINRITSNKTKLTIYYDYYEYGYFIENTNLEIDFLTFPRDIQGQFDILLKYLDNVEFM